MPKLFQSLRPYISQISLLHYGRSGIRSSNPTDAVTASGNSRNPWQDPYHPQKKLTGEYQELENWDLNPRGGLASVSINGAESAGPSEVDVEHGQIVQTVRVEVKGRPRRPEDGRKGGL
jgi:hypothetical protein